MRRRRRHRRRRHRHSRHRHSRFCRCCGVVGLLAECEFYVTSHESRIPFFAYTVLSRYGQGSIKLLPLYCV